MAMMRKLGCLKRELIKGEVVRCVGDSAIVTVTVNSYGGAATGQILELHDPHLVKSSWDWCHRMSTMRTLDCFIRGLVRKERIRFVGKSAKITVTVNSHGRAVTGQFT